jgi:hypothetical protein
MEISVLQNITQSYSYDEYKKMVIKYAEEYSTSGEQLKERIAATLINAQRMKRIDKQCIINYNLHTLISQINRKQKWLLISESWCGDSAQCVPVIAKMAELNKNILLEIIFRDEHLDLMDNFLTNGSRSIPKLICIDEKTDSINFIWGPRPKAIQDRVSELKKNFPEITHDELVKNIHLWYAQDKTKSIQAEFIELLNKSNFES